MRKQQTGGLRTSDIRLGLTPVRGAAQPSLGDLVDCCVILDDRDRVRFRAKGGKLASATQDRVGDGALIESILAAANLFLDLAHRGRVVLNARVLWIDVRTHWAESD